MRKYLKDIEIVGATMVYQEGEQCRWSLDWLYSNCDRVCILMDNYDEKTMGVVNEYKEKYPDRTHIGYSNKHVRKDKNLIQGQIKKRFKNMQSDIRECVFIELRKMHKEKPIDLLVFPDSDETFIDQFTVYLEEFWNNRAEDYMMLGFVEVYDEMNILMRHIMSPHGRVFKYKPNISAFPPRARTRYEPYYNEAKPWKVRNLVLHMCHYTKEYRDRRQFFDNRDWTTECERSIWILPKDVRKMTVEEIADYQPGYRQAPSKYPSISLEEYINNKGD